MNNFKQGEYIYIPSEVTLYRFAATPSEIKKTYITYGYLSKYLISNIIVPENLNKRIIIHKVGYKKKILNYSKNLMIDPSFVKRKNISLFILKIF